MRSPDSFTLSAEKADEPVLQGKPVTTHSLTQTRSSSFGQTKREYCKSFRGLHYSQKVCKVLNVMTLGPVPAGQPLTADSEVRGAVARRIPLSPRNSRWYFHAVAIVRVGKPPRTPTRAVATSGRPPIGVARSVKLRGSRMESAAATRLARQRPSLSRYRCPVDLAIPR